MIPVDQCQNRRLYRLISRNLKVGVFEETTGLFFGLRTKFDSCYVDRERHRELGGSAAPIEELPDVIPDDIELVTVFGSVCETCGVPVEFHPSTKWVHLTATDCQNLKPTTSHNHKLKAWLVDVQRKYTDEKQP